MIRLQHDDRIRRAWRAIALRREGRLLPVLADRVLPPANDWLLFQTCSHRTAKPRPLLDFLLGAFGPQRAGGRRGRLAKA